MKKIIFLVAVFSVVVAEEFIEKPTPFTLGGVQTNWGQFAASVIIDGPNEFCGGSIIERSHILTAASCLLNENFEIINPMWFKVIAGDIFFSPASFRRVERNVSRIFIHPNFNSFTGENNVAVIRLDEQLPLPHNTIDTAIRQTRIIRNGVPCQVVAFGRASNVTVAWQPRQMVLNLNVFDRDSCGAVNLIHANRISETMMCVQSTNALAPCAGNLGSGLYCDGRLAGVLSGGITCNATPAVFQQTRAFNSWIDEQILRRDLANEAGTIPFNNQGMPRTRR